MVGAFWLNVADILAGFFVFGVVSTVYGMVAYSL